MRKNTFTDGLPGARCQLQCKALHLLYLRVTPGRKLSFPSLYRRGSWGQEGQCTLSKNIQLVRGRVICSLSQYLLLHIGCEKR